MLLTGLFLLLSQLSRTVHATCLEMVQHRTHSGLGPPPGSTSKDVHRQVHQSDGGYSSVEASFSQVCQVDSRDPPSQQCICLLSFFSCVEVFYPFKEFYLFFEKRPYVALTVLELCRAL